MGSLSPTEIRILYLLIKSPTLLTVDALSATIGLSPSHISRIMNKLEKIGLISHITASIADSFKNYLLVKLKKEPPSSTLTGKTKLFYPMVTMDELLNKFPEFENLIKVWEESGG